MDSVITFCAIEWSGRSMLIRGVFAVAANRLSAVLWNVCERGTRTAAFTARHENRSGLGKLLEVGLMLFVTVLAHALGFGTD